LKYFPLSEKFLNWSYDEQAGENKMLTLIFNFNASLTAELNAVSRFEKNIRSN